MICTWDHPGVDRYTGTVPQAIVAYHLPIATQSELISKFERRQFQDTVTIDRDTIRGEHSEYDPTIRSMHFGSAGATCDPSRTGWTAAHVERALVVCTDDGSECIAWPAVCGNIFRLSRVAGRPARDGLVGPGLVPPGPEFVGLLAPPDALPLPWEPTGAGVASSGLLVSPEASSFGTPSYTPPVTQIVPAIPTTPAIPEPDIWALLISGLVVIYLTKAQQ